MLNKNLFDLVNGFYPQLQMEYHGISPLMCVYIYIYPVEVSKWVIPFTNGYTMLYPSFHLTL